ncbi:glycosyltransferase family 4 protein [Moorella naiadis]|uniref:glycosyltransferase family 4 protein n=1 Tax=Moorella naiadis (nom. illeg.) TaxID=3093670 RepID=UPI003D9C7E86
MIQYYPDHPSGSARLAFDEAVFLAKAGHEVWVITQDTSGSKPEYCFQDGLHVLRYPAPHFAQFNPRRIWAHQKRTRELLARYVGFQVDLVHGHSLLHYDGVLSLYGGKVRTCYSVHSPVRLEMVATGRGARLPRRLGLVIAAYLNHEIEGRCLERSDCITAFSEYTKAMLGRLHGDDIRRRTQVIPGWVDLDRFKIIQDREAAKSQLGWPRDVPVFFTLRRLVPRMGLDRLLYALREVKSAGREFYLVIGGGGPLQVQLETLAEELGLKGYVNFTGFVPEDILPAMYAAADAFILPTVEMECFGLIALEALACGRPVLVTPVGAIPEVVGRFERRWLAEDTSVRAISHLLSDFLRGVLPSHDPTALRETVARYYSRERVLGQLIATAQGARNIDSCGGE